MSPDFMAGYSPNELIARANTMDMAGNFEMAKELRIHARRILNAEKMHDLIQDFEEAAGGVIAITSAATFPALDDCLVAARALLTIIDRDE